MLPMARAVATDELARFDNATSGCCRRLTAMLPTAHGIATDEPVMLPMARSDVTDGECFAP